MSVERITVNGRELTAFDLPPEPSDEYTVHVDGLGEVTVTRDGPTMHDKTAEYMGKMVDGLCAHVADLQAENAKLREAVATAIKVQVVLCGDADRPYCSNECPLHRQESDDCLACDVIGVAQELGIEVY